MLLQGGAESTIYGLVGACCVCLWVLNGISRPPPRVGSELFDAPETNSSLERNKNTFFRLATYLVYVDDAGAPENHAGEE